MFHHQLINCVMVTLKATKDGWVQILARVALPSSVGNAYNYVMNLGVAWCALLRFKAPPCTLQTRWLGIENIHCLVNRRPSQL